MYFDLTPADIRATCIRQPLPDEIAEMKQDREEMPDPAWQRIVSLRADGWAVELAAHPSERTPKPQPVCTAAASDWDRTPKPRPTWVYCGPTPKPPQLQLDDSVEIEEEGSSVEEPEAHRALVGLGFGF